MFALKQLVKGLILPPTPWIVLLVLVCVFWRRRWARRLLVATTILIFLLHFGWFERLLRYPLESRFAPLRDPRQAPAFDAIVVLTAESTPAGGLIPYPTLDESMFRRLDEAWRLYRLLPRPIIVAGGHVDPFTPARDENKIACDYLRLWGVRAEHVIAEPRSRDTFESALEVRRILEQRKWTRYLLVTSAVHMPRSMLAFAAVSREPIPAPADFTIGEQRFTPLALFPSESAARGTMIAIHEYIGLVNYFVRARSYRAR
ncbi:MAG TPA: YdcF family protein [Candidatus Acidoferrales bacterium]|nr:YdcF family protein [Candidatus Acidoferrales bacterium]